MPIIVTLSCILGFVLYVVAPPLIDLIYNDTYLEGEFATSYFLFYTCSILLFAFTFFLLFSRKFACRFFVVETFYSFVAIVFLVKATCIAIDIPTGVYFSGERNRFLPLAITSIVDIMFLTALIHLERSPLYRNSGLFLAGIFILFRFVEMVYIDGSRRGLLFAIWPFLFYACIKLPLIYSIFLGAFSVFLVSVGLIVYGYIRNGGRLDEIVFDVKYLDFFNIYQANIEVYNYMVSMASHENIYNGITYLKIFLVGMLNFFDLRSSPVSVFVADVIYGRPEMTINPGMFGEALVNFGIYYYLALLPICFYFIFMVICSLQMGKSAFSTMLLSASSFLIWRGQFESCVYLIIPVFLNLIFDNSKRN